MKKLVILVMVIIMVIPIFAYARECDPVSISNIISANNPANLGCVDTDGGDHPLRFGKITSSAGDLLWMDTVHTYYAADRTTVLYYAVQEFFCEKNPQTGQFTGRGMYRIYKCPCGVKKNELGEAVCSPFSPGPVPHEKHPVPLK